MDSRFSYHKASNKGVAQRKNARINCNLAATYRLSGGQNVTTSITVLSSGGVSFQGKSVLLAGEKIELSFKIKERLLHLDAEITRIMGNEYGCKFLNISEEEQNMLNQYITKSMFNPSQGRKL